MRLRHRLPLVVAVGLAAAFAPAPLPRTGVAEAVVNSFGRGAAGVRQSLLAALPGILQSEQVKGLACLKGERSRANWVAERLRVEEALPVGAVRLRLSGCRPNEALALLSAIVEGYANDRRVRMDVEVREAQFRARRRQILALAAQGGGVAPVLLFEEALERRGGPAVIQRPRLVSAGSAR
jgi:hypothetical protein